MTARRRIDGLSVLLGSLRICESVVSERRLRWWILVWTRSGVPMIIEDEEAKANAAAFTAFFDSEFPGQLRRAAMLLRDRDAAHDVVHDALLQVWQRWGDLADPGPYLNRCVLNGCRDHASSRRRRRTLGAEVMAESTHPAGFAELHDVLLRLPFNQRAAVVLKFYGGLSTDEIAASLDCPIGSVGPWIQRAKRHLLKELT